MVNKMFENYHKSLFIITIYQHCIIQTISKDSITKYEFNIIFSILSCFCCGYDYWSNDYRLYLLNSDCYMVNKVSISTVTKFILSILLH